jgi:hypothetical protein
LTNGSTRRKDLMKLSTKKINPLYTEGIFFVSLSL